ncbi:MAG: GspE/PulE family protein [Bacilli bacterium]|nr:GspE/PulE family protein [Bacilli bacterium]
MLKIFDFEKMPVVEVVNEILVDAAKRGASDIHMDAHEEFMKIRIRIDGSLIDYAEVPNTIRKNLITRVKIISGMNITESRLPQDGAIKTTLKDLDLDLRVSCLPTNLGEKIVIRILDYSLSLSGLEHLGFSESNYHKILKMISIPNGIVLVTGATGSGKSTTVYSILQRLNREETNVITVEDPIEMNIEGINQVQTNSEIGLTFANALRSILRQDPDVIMIGEIRDTETAKIAVRASITGHIVLSTLHTNDSLTTIERLVDMGVERYLLASSLTGIVSQKLARKLCPNCRKKRPTNDYEKHLFKTVLNKDVNEVYIAEGCEQCNNGYSGRIAIHEVLLIDELIKDAISNDMEREELRELVYNSDVTTLIQDGLEKVESGLTTVEELLKIIELESDDKSYGKMDLKSSLDATNIALHSNKKQEKKEEPIVNKGVKQEDNLQNGNETPKEEHKPYTIEEVSF